MHRKSILGTSLLGALVAASFAPAQAETTITMTVTDVPGLEELRRDWSAFKNELEANADVTVEFAPVTSRTAAVELLRSERVDFVLTGPAEYVVMRHLSDAEPVLGFTRPDYFSGVVTMADSGITSVEDLEGRKVAVGDVGSTSSHLGPLQVISDYGLAPQEDVDLVHTKPKVAYQALKKGDVAAWGTNYMDDYMYLRKQDDDTSAGAFRVIARGPDLPNDVFVAGDHVDDNVVESVKTAIVDNSDAMVEAIVEDGGAENRKYEGMQFVANIDDSDYSYIRKAYRTIGQDDFGKFPGE